MESDHGCLNAGGSIDTLRIVTEGAHEVRSQLAVLLLELGKINHPHSHRIEAGVRTASETVNRIAVLFKLATTDTLAGSGLNLDEILTAVVQRSEPDYPGRRYPIDIRKLGNGTLIHGHGAFVAEAIRSIVDNALRHTSARSQVVVSSRPDGLVTIDDDGPGVPLSVTSKFGQPFVNGRVPTAGPGLGLAIAYQVARLHGGRCFLAPSELGGTCVCIEFNPRSASANRT
jgi:signal transduction histidine kinase